MTNRTGFEEHWAAYEDIGLPPTKVFAGEAFLRPLRNAGSVGRKILDVGCGDGVHAHILSADLVDYTGIDISMSALTATRNRSKGAKLIQADALNIPIRDDNFDIVFSFGVLAYTDDPKKGVREMARVAKPGALVGLWLCPRDDGIGGLSLRIVRIICQKIGPWATRRVADLIVPFLSFLPVRSGVNLSNASWKQCVEIVMVNIQPEGLTFPEVEEVLQWFKDANLRVTSNDQTNPITIWGIKNSKTE